MKKVLLSAILVISVLFSNAQCDIKNGSTVSAGAPVVNGNGSTTYTFTLIFDLQNNNGNKYIDLNLWLPTQYPLSLTTGTMFPPTCAQLATSLTNLSIDNNINAPAQPTLLTTYNSMICTPAIIPQTAGIIISKQYNPANDGYDRFTLQNVKVTIPASAPSPIVYFFLWSSQAQSQNSASCSFGPIILMPTGGALPISLTSFLVGRTGSSISLNWKMETGSSISSFEVERSFDNVSYKTIGSVAGNGISTTSSTQSYSYIDNSNNSKSVSFYRLKIVKQGGEIAYSDIKTVKGFGGKADFVLFPNPSFGNARITISDISEPTSVQLLDNSGRIIKSLLLNNSNTTEINGLQKGGYFVRITGTTTGVTTVKKLTVIN